MPRNSLADALSLSATQSAQSAQNNTHSYDGCGAPIQLQMHNPPATSADVVLRAAAFRESTGEMSAVATLRIKKESNATPVRLLGTHGSPWRYVL
jgi:hypothetical protein